MPTLHVDLREGFTRDTVVIRVDGREIYHRTDVETNYSVGLADRVTAEVPRGPVRVEILLPQRDQQQSLTLPMDDSAALGFSLDPSGVLTGGPIDVASRYL